MSDQPISDETRKALEAIRGVLAIGYPRTQGDMAEYHRIVAANAVGVTIMINSVLEAGGSGGGSAGTLEWALAYMTDHAEPAPVWHVPDYMKALDARRAAAAEQEAGE